MLDKVLSLIPDKKKRNVAYSAGGMLLVLGGNKVGGLALFMKGNRGLEKIWRDEHQFTGTFAERWKHASRFYDRTHQNKTNRKLHIVGIPIILAGTAGLLIFPVYRPLWALSAGAFTFGWVLNFIGHGLYEKNAPAFADDPLSFIAGPIWDFQQMKKRKNKDGSEDTVIDVDGQLLTVDLFSPELPQAMA